MLLLLGWGGLEVGTVTKACHVSRSQLCTCPHQSHPACSFLALYSQREHGAYAASGDSADHKHGAMDPDLTFGGSMIPDITTASVGSAGLSHQYGPGSSTAWVWLQAVTQTKDILMMLGGNTATDINLDPDYIRTTDPHLINITDHVGPLKRSNPESELFFSLNLYHCPEPCDPEAAWWPVGVGVGVGWSCVCVCVCVCICISFRLLHTTQSIPLCLSTPPSQLQFRLSQQCLRLCSSFFPTLLPHRCSPSWHRPALFVLFL